MSGSVEPGDEIVQIDATPVHGLPLSVLAAALLGVSIILEISLNFFQLFFVLDVSAVKA